MAVSRAMAADAPIDPAQAKALTSVLGWLAGLATAAIGAIGLWLAQRVLGKAAFQTAISEGFNKLTDQLQEERERLTREIAAERAQHEAERVAWHTQRATLKGEIRNLKQAVWGLEKRLGLNPREPVFEDEPETFLELPGKRKTNGDEGGHA